MGGGPVTPTDLRNILTPALFNLVARARLPYSKLDSIDWAKFGDTIFRGGDNFVPTVEGKAWPALLALSKIGLDKMPDLSQYLPSPADPSYPEQCLGFQILLDCCPRSLFSGVDHRWTFGYFNVLSERLAHSWLGLPADQRPDSWGLWRDAAGIDYWLAVRFWLGTPFVHSQEPANQEIALQITEETRVAVEVASGQTDPYRAQRDAVLTDIYGFPREYRIGPPEGKVTRESYMWWSCMLMDIHKPIIDRFGRYPYSNGILGRESTAEENKWIKETSHFGDAPAEVAKKIKKDVERGVWRPLGEDSLPPISM